VTFAILLGVLAVFDFVLAGFRSAAGRDGRIRKMPMFRVAMLRGGVWGLAVVGVHAVVAGVLVASGDATTWPALVDAARDAVIVFGVFATATLLALGFWFAPMQELRLVPTLIVLGPLTLLRPLVIGGGLAWAAVRSPEPRVWILAGCAGISMLCAERLLGRPYRERWKRLLTR
jgi:hypothetical protein